ncbi:MAG: 16S rRNA (cytidine(1402)-2'-O)-methyltransferase [Bacillota bacterium]
MSHWVYMVRCRDGTFYTGYTTDVERRVREHNGEAAGGARYTRGRGPVTLVYREECGTMGDALRRERAIKGLPREAKERLAAADVRGAADVDESASPPPQAAPQPGRLMVCATPIGNLDDITLRVLEALRQADLVAAEDTRQTRKLLSHFEISAHLTSYHQHNRKSKGKVLLDELLGGKTVALVSDAGLPGVSDPGEDIIAAAIAAGVKVEVLPGPSAALTALVGSGLPTGRFAFEGFLPRSGSERRQRLSELAGERRTLIFYEAPHRLRETLRDLLGALGDRRAAAARELTKRFEEVRRAPLSELVRHYDQEDPRGEFTLVVEGAGEPPAAAEGGDADRAAAGMDRSPRALAARVRALESDGKDRRSAMKQVAHETGLSRRDVYRALLLEET